MVFSYIASMQAQFHFVTPDEQKLMKMSCAESKELSVTDTLLPVCSSVNGLSGGREVVQRASFFGSRLWVLQLCLTLMQPELCVTRTPTNQPNYALAGKKYTHTNRALFRLAAELWPS